MSVIRQSFAGLTQRRIGVGLVGINTREFFDLVVTGTTCSPLKPNSRPGQKFPSVSNLSSHAFNRQRRGVSTSTMRGTPVMLNVFDPWLPAPVSLSEKGRKALVQRAKRALTYAYSLYLLRKNSLSVKQFKTDAETLYITLNTAQAAYVPIFKSHKLKLINCLFSADKQLLERATSISYANILNASFKKLKRSDFIAAWSYSGPIIINVINLVAANVQSAKDKETVVIQITAKIVSNQSYAVYNAHTKKLAGGDPENFTPVVEYVVFERKLDDEDKSGWRIAGKIEPKNENTPP
ncbi:hypothetical protein HK100_001497 [Physocladia obscura]|uniref:Large ribosomal subunit protein mL45 n=1 Tax=Physocladia obscura TaxID=109957 RepID=A0AAD5SX22_9FUNG|nr:hypothetical protein HK100_001497 [Physocladia obscura]